MLLILGPERISSMPLRLFYMLQRTTDFQSDSDDDMVGPLPPTVGDPDDDPEEEEVHT